MTSDALPGAVDNDMRPPKRPRPSKDVDEGLRPYTIPMSGSSGLHSEGDGVGESNGKRARKRPLSCGECRRLKLKCDRVFPCQSCCKRGCAEICPDGALTGGKGSRFILANTEQLHDKIKSMSERIRELEEALQALQARLSAEEHPLLRQELLLIKKSPELFGVEQGSSSSSPNHDSHRRDDEHPRPGLLSSSREGADECLLSLTSSHNRRHNDHLYFHDDFARLGRSFPSPWSISYELNPGMRQRIREMLPPRSEAQYLCEQARVNAFWQFNPDASETFLPNLIHSVYEAPISSLLPHRLGLFLMILAIGSRVDLKQAPDCREAEKYHHLARTALCEVPVMDDTSFDGVNALFFMVWYLLMFSGEKKAVEYAWGIMGLMTKLAHTIGLHRDGVRSKVIPEELDKRRALFWDMMGMDARLSLMLRRPPSLNVRHVDAKQPTYSSDGPVASVGSSYHEWQHTFLIHCILPVVEMISSSQAQPYPEVLGLDCRIRDFIVPAVLQMMDHDGVSPSHPMAMQQAMTACTREIALLQLHRSYFTHALNATEGFTIKHKYAPSVLAVYTSSCNLIWTVYTLYRWEPELSTRFSPLWSNCFSASVALCFFVSQAPSCLLTPHALQELDRVLRLFAQARDSCPAVAKVLPALHVLTTRSRANYMRWRNGTQSGICDENDEICELARRTGILSSPNGGHMAVDGAELNPFENAHPTLRRCFEQATTEDPCANDSLCRIRGPVTGLSSVGEIAMGSSSAAYSSLGGFGADIQESSWMSWL